MDVRFTPIRSNEPLQTSLKGPSPNGPRPSEPLLSLCHLTSHSMAELGPGKLSPPLGKVEPQHSYSPSRKAKKPTR